MNITVGLIVVLSAIGVQADTIMNTSGAYTNAANWSNGLPTTQANPGTIGAGITATFGAGNCGWLLRSSGSGSDVAQLTINGGTVSKADNSSLTAGSNGRLIINSGTVTNYGSLLFNRASFDLNGGSMLSQRDVAMYGTGGDVLFDRSTISGGTLNARDLMLSSTTQIKEFYITGGTVTLRNLATTNVGGFFTFASNSTAIVTAAGLDFRGTNGYINFETGSLSTNLSTLTVAGYDYASFSNLYANQQLRLNGATTNSFDSVFEVYGSTLSLPITRFLGGSYTVQTNWTAGMPTNANVTAVIGTSGTISAGGNLVYRAFPTTGGSIATATFTNGTLTGASGNVTIGSNGRLIIDGGFLALTNANTSTLSINRGSLELKSGSLTIGKSINLYGTQDAANPLTYRMTVSGGTVLAGNLLMGSTNSTYGHKEYYFSGGTITITNAMVSTNYGSAFIFAAGGNATVSTKFLTLSGSSNYVDFLSDALTTNLSTLTVAGYDYASFSNLYANQQLRLNGATTNSFDSIFKVTGNTLSLYNDVVILYVHPDGLDSNPGTQALPFKSLSRAKEAVRATNQTMQTDIIVNLGEGIYRLTAPLQFTPEDSGFNGNRIVYRSKDGVGKACIRGGEVLTGWTLHSGSVWKVPVQSNRVFHTLYENGQRVYKARLPNYQYDTNFLSARTPYFKSQSGSDATNNTTNTSWLIYYQADFDPDAWGAIGNMKINIFPWGVADWHRWICDVAQIDTATRRLTFYNMKDRTRIEGGARYFLEDHPAFLDAPGEFYLNTAENMLYYIPLGSGHPDTLNISAPLIKDIFRLQGTSTSTVNNITFEGLDLGETDGIAPVRHWWIFNWGMTDNALIWMNLSSNIRVMNCRLANSGRHGVLMAGGNLSNRVEGCLVEEMGVSGLKISNLLANGAGRGPANPSKLHVLTNNRIGNVGQLALYASCIGIHGSSSNEVSYSELYNSARYAITMRGNTSAQAETLGVNTNLPPTAGNVLRNLLVFNCGQDSGDMGALHTAGVNIIGGSSINTFEQIIIDKAWAVPGMNDYAPNAVFLDWPDRSMNQVFRNIQATNIQGPQFRSNGLGNENAAVFSNVSWQSGFNTNAMDFSNIGVRSDYSAEFAGGNSGGNYQISPSITTQPQSQNYVTAGTNVTFSVVVLGTAPFSYQWKKDGANTGTNSSSLNLTNVQTNNVGNYTVVISNVVGVVTSSVATLGINPATSVTGTISANPTTVLLPPGQTMGETKISFSTSPLTTSQVYVKAGGGMEVLFLQETQYTNASAPWIQAGLPYVFNLYEGTNRAIWLATVTVTAQSLQQNLPSPWATADIGSVGVAGSATESGGTFTIEGSGNDIWNTEDEFRFVYQSAGGDCEIKSRVTAVENTDPWAKAGVMVRETLNANSMYAMMDITPSNGACFQYRTSTGGSCSNSISSGKTAPYWVRVVRSGNSFSGYMSTNGTTWTQVGASQTISMGTNTYMGMAVTSRTNTVLCTTTNDNVTAVP
jgi:hypothetical protein